MDKAGLVYNKLGMGWYCPIYRYPEVRLDEKHQLRRIEEIIKESRTRNVVVETTSELMVMRVRRRVAEGSLRPSDVKGFYIKTPKSRLVLLKLDESGNFTNWPKGLFDEVFNESMAAIKAITT